MRRLFSMAAFGFGFYYLWNNTDMTTEMVALGAMGVAVLLEFAGQLIDSAHSRTQRSSSRFSRTLHCSRYRRGFTFERNRASGSLAV